MRKWFVEEQIFRLQILNICTFLERIYEEALDDGYDENRKQSYQHDQLKWSAGLIRWKLD